jgi:hypothetical protein
MSSSICGFSIPNPRDFFSPITNGTAQVTQAVRRVFECAKAATGQLRALIGKIASFINESKRTIFFIGLSAAVAVLDPVRFLGAFGVGVVANLVLGGVARGHQVLLASGSMNEATVAQASLAAVHMACRAIQSTSASHVFPSNFREGAVSSMLSGLWAGFVLTDVGRRFFKTIDNA